MANKTFEDGSHAVRHSNRFLAELSSELIIEKTLMRSIKCAGGLTRGRGFDENVRNFWVMSISYSATVYKSMIKSSGSMNQNIDMGMESANVTMIIVKKCFNLFEIRYPFNMNDSNTYSLSTGLVSVYDKDPVNCGQTEITVARV